ncbi:poly(A)-specific ribonuclease [Trifolium repens]|nr:poly(A)-specific ribonuclease [Trifolium repens]
MVGDETIGNEHPIRIQTMTTTNTKDVAGTVMKIADKRADIVRITVHGKKEADACFEIKNSLVQKNYNIPLVADIHFVETSIFSLVETTKLSMFLDNSSDSVSVIPEVAAVHMLYYCF